MLKHLRASEEWSEKNLAQKGFTLVELLVVIVILGILAAVVVFAVGGTTNNAQTKSCKADASALTTAAEAYYASELSYPGSQAALTTGGSANKYLKKASDWYTLVAGGSDVTSLAAGKCVGITG